MAELSKRWARVKSTDNRGEWWLSAPGHCASNRAYIGWPMSNGQRMLMLWIDAETGWDVHMTSDDLKTLKAIGRIEAARRLHA